MHDWLTRYIVRTAAQKTISLSEAMSKRMYGPFFHGTDEAGRQAIGEKGFEIIPADDPRRKNGYEAAGSYLSRTGTPPPIHHLGYGIYLTANKNIAKEYSGGTTRGMKTYYVDAPDMLTINFGSENTMMKWWKGNGYDYDALRAAGMSVEDARVKGTEHLTSELSKYGAVYFKGKGLYKLLDGDQVCVYDPVRIFEIDLKASSGKIEPGARVKRKTDGMTGTILSSMDAAPLIEGWKGGVHPWIKPGTTKILHVKWKKGGTDYNVQDIDVDPV